MAKKLAAAEKKKPKKNSVREAVDDDLEEWKRSKQLLKPKDQIELQDAELKEVIGRQLVMTNVQLPENIVQFNYAEGCFTRVLLPSNYVLVFDRRTSAIRLESDEARNQLMLQGIDPNTYIQNLGLSPIGSEEIITEEKKEEEEVQEEESQQPGSENVGEGEEGGEEGGGGEGADTVSKQPEEGEEEAAPKSKGQKKLTNQFNFCERAALTYNPPFRTQETQTIPPPVKTFSANVLQWVIYDSYLIDYEEQLAEKERERERKEMGKAPVSKTAAAPKKKGKASKGGKGLSEAVQARVFECWKVLERMINLNSYDDIAKDYRYWEDPSDEYREEEGTLLPLWKYCYEKTKKHTVTHLFWNPWYYDLFIACFGYFDFLKPIGEGYICLFTIKNPSFPENIIVTESAVRCADIHPKYPYMLACGLFDGNLVIYNVQHSCKEPVFNTACPYDKHNGLIWSVKWVPDLPDGELNLYTVGNDGKVNNYILMQNQLNCTTLLNLMLDQADKPGPDGILFKLKACATYITLHPKNPTIYLVGTEEGTIYKCSINYSSQYLFTYQAHHMPVYKIDYNKYNSDIFISCSADWRIKIWEDNRSDPLFVFDLGACISDVEWAPYSSTVFGAVTTEGKVYIFDLNLNKYKYVCIQAVVSKKRYKLTTISFNHNLPIIIVGDDKGTVTSLKLSPNLRIPCKPPKKAQHLDQFTLQCMKLDRLLSLVREPNVLQVNIDNNSNTS